MEVHPLLGQLDKLLAEEGELVGRGPLALPHQGISPGMRDGSAHVLRCLKVWFELPTDVFHTATANIDTFLAKMKVNPHQISKYFDIIYFNINSLRCKQKKVNMSLFVQAQPKHLSCIAVAAFHLACNQYKMVRRLK